MMNQETYDYVLEILSREPSFSEGIRKLQSRWPTVFESVSEKTLKSIQAQYYVRRMRRNHYHHYSRETREKYYKLYKNAKSRNEQNVIMRLAAKNDISPCLLARIILEEYYWNDVDQGKDRERGEGRGSLPPGFMTDCIRDIAKLPNPELAREIYETTVLDNFYGPAVDSIKKCCGVEYENLLKSHCRKAGFSFMDEGQMREEGYDKTPDIKLNVPVMINHRVVNWIESKASFGDPINHQQYMIDQYLPYKNRFGPGAVIYWFGFVQELSETGERAIFLLSKFPDTQDITQLRDAQEREINPVGFHLLSQFDKNTVTNDDSLSSVDHRSKFYNYVDPIFDSDEVDGIGVSLGAVQPSCCFLNVSSQINAEVCEKHKNYEYLYLPENVLTKMSVNDSESINTDQYETNMSTECVKCENVMCSEPVNKIYAESVQICTESMTCTSNTFEAATEINSEKSLNFRNDGHVELCEDVNNHEKIDISFVDDNIIDNIIVHQDHRTSSCDSVDITQDHFNLNCSASNRINCPEDIGHDSALNHLDKLSSVSSINVVEESTTSSTNRQAFIKSPSSNEPDKKVRRKEKRNW